MKILRRILEYAPRKFHILRHLQVAGKRFPIYLSPSSQLKYLKIGSKYIDADLLQVVSEQVKPGMVVWDIGANIGVCSFASSVQNQGATVVVAEPDLYMLTLLNKTRRNKFYKDRDIRIIPVAISDRVGVLTLNIAKRGRAANHIDLVQGSSQTGGVADKHFVASLTLDSILTVAPPPQFIKIDIEGAETLALKGADVLLQKHRPTIYCEISPTNLLSCRSIINKHNYSIEKIGNANNFLLSPL